MKKKWDENFHEGGFFQVFKQNAPLQELKMILHNLLCENERKKVIPPAFGSLERKFSGGLCPFLAKVIASRKDPTLPRW